MGYLFSQDYKSLIQTDSLTQIIGADTSLLTQAEQAAQSLLTSYLVQKYDLAKEFTETMVWSPLHSYDAKDRFYLNANAYSAASTYTLNALVLYNGFVYKCSTAITVAEAWDASKWTVIGAQYAMFYAKTPENDWSYYTTYSTGDKVFYNDKTYTATLPSTGIAPDTSTSAWGTGTTYSVIAATAPTDTTKYTAGDNRNQQLVEYMVDVILFRLHSRIAPHNIPELRERRYDDVISWLKNVAKGENITADIARIQPTSGARIRWGSALPKQNNNF
nr:phage protein Gp36 family protein [uncultured Flavobacterium sp.]